MIFDRMRELLLDQAIQGKLVPQESDEVVVDQIGTKPGVVPFTIPDSWHWVTLESISSVISKGTTPKGGKSAYSPSGIGFVRVNNFGDDGQIDTREMKFIDEKVHQGELKRSVLEADDVLVSIAGTLGRTIVVRESDLPLNVNQAVSFIRLHKNEANSWYVHLAISSPSIQKRLRSKVKVTAIPNLTLQIIRECVIPLPPLGEQTRIVAKLEEAFAEIDRAEKAYEELQTLAGVLRGQILQKAIQGQLVNQLDTESSVEMMGDAPNDVPFSIPEKWKWYYLGSVIEYGKSNQVSCDEITSQTWVLDLEDIEKNTGRILEKKRGVSSTSNKNKFESGYVLYSKLRPYLNKVVVADEAGVCTTEIVPINVNGAAVPLDAKYLQTYLMSPFFVNYANQASYGVKMPRLGTKDARAALIPIPPLEEQKRIVQKVVELLSQTDSLAGS